VFEDDSCTNAGRGSNLTEDGGVECDASVIDGKSGAFGAVGAVPGTCFLITTQIVHSMNMMMGTIINSNCALWRNENDSICIA